MPRFTRAVAPWTLTSSRNNYRERKRQIRVNDRRLCRRGNEMEDRVVALSIAQQAAYAALERQLAEHNVAVLSARAGMGKTRILRALHTVTGGLYLTSREFVEASAHAHPLSLDETIYAVLRQSLEAHDTVIVDDFQFVSLVACCVHAYPRQNFLGAALLPLAAMAQSHSK